MWYRTVGCLITIILLMAPLAADVQPAGKIRHVGWLRTGTHPPPSLVEALLHGLRDMGYVEGQNLVIEYRSGPPASLPALATELVRLPVEILVANEVAAALAAKKVTSTLPIVFAGPPDPVARGLITSWAQPGGNVTGVAGPSGESLVPKQLELFKEVVPAVTRVAWLAEPINPDDPIGGANLKAIQAAAQRLGIDLHRMEVRDPPNGIEEAFAALAHERVDALFVGGGLMLAGSRTRIVELVATTRLPALYPYVSYVEAGGLMSYHVDWVHAFRRVGVMVGKILGGAKPADIPAEFTMQFALSINLKTARALGLTIPPHILILADRVIQ